MRRLILVPLAVVVLATGCSTFDSDVVARVDDAELTRDQLDELIQVLRPGTDGDADTAREMINLWIAAEALESALEVDGLEIDNASVETATQALEGSGLLANLSDDLTDQFIGWQAAFEVGFAQSETYGNDAVNRAETWIKPRFGQIGDGTVLPLALDTAPVL